MLKKLHMKKILSFVILFTSLCTFSAYAGKAGCQKQTDSEADRMPFTVSQIDAAKADKKVLVAFFSHTGENYNVGYIEKGNTHIVAEMIAEETGGKLFEIKTVKPYPKEYRPFAPTWPNRKRIATPVPNCNRICKWKTMTSFSSVTPTGGVTCRWRSIPLLRNTTGREKRSFHSALMRAAVYQVPGCLLKSPAKVRLYYRALP